MSTQALLASAGLSHRVVHCGCGFTPTERWAESLAIPLDSAASWGACNASVVSFAGVGFAKVAGSVATSGLLRGQGAGLKVRRARAAGVAAVAGLSGRARRAA